MKSAADWPPTASQRRFDRVRRRTRPRAIGARMAPQRLGRSRSSIASVGRTLASLITLSLGAFCPLASVGRTLSVARMIRTPVALIPYVVLVTVLLSALLWQKGDELI